MKKIVLSMALAAVMILGTSTAYAQTPEKKEVKKEQTDKKECKKECTKECKKECKKADKATCDKKKADGNSSCCKKK